LMKDVTDLLWDIRRERVIKVDIIRHYQGEIVSELIKLLAPAGQLNAATYRIFEADAALTAWKTDPVVRAKSTQSWQRRVIPPNQYLRRPIFEVPPRSM
jgi:hypothetical protein